MKTFHLKQADISRHWVVVDATEAPLGRLATLIATRLTGKYKPTFTPHVDDGDYVIVEKKDAYIPENGDIVVSNIGGLANVKRFARESDRIVLTSQSARQSDFLPIFIHEDDDYSAEGKVIDIIKAVR